MSISYQDQLLRLCTETPVTNVRNFCILAHVDHGKTTISDHLLTTNGLLSSQLAGQVRYLDSRPDEQERLITMKASSVALCHRLEQSKIDCYKALEEAAAERARVLAEAEAAEEAKNQNESESKSSSSSPSETATQMFQKIETKQGTFVCNLLDCPGHIDFSSEVAAAVRLCDGAVVVVDLVDGVTMVTRAMLRQCYLEGLPMVLLLNKLDYIILKMKLTPEEGFARMSLAVAECNAFLASCVNAEDIAAAGLAPDQNNINNNEDEENMTSNNNINNEDDDQDNEQDNDEQQQQQQREKEQNEKTAEEKKRGDHLRRHHHHRALEVPDDEIWFCPTKGNVVFASGLHGFGFQLSDFAALYKPKLPKLSTIELTRGLWGEHYLDTKTMTITDKPKKEGTSCLGLTFFCEPLWKLHTEFETSELDEEKIREMLSKIGLNPRPNFFKTSAQVTQNATQRYGAASVHLPKLFQLLGEWMPLSRTLLDTICCRLPCPLESQGRRAPVLLPECVAVLDKEFAHSQLSEKVRQEAPLILSPSEQSLSRAVKTLAACSRDENAPLYAFVAKLLDVQYLAGVLPSGNEGGAYYSTNNILLDASSAAAAQGRPHGRHGGERGIGNEKFDLDQYFVALTRVYSGRIKAGQSICVDSGGKPKMCKVQEVYILRGQGLEKVPFVAAGNICAIRGCSKDIVKCGTICDGDVICKIPPTAAENENDSSETLKTGEVAFQNEFDRFNSLLPKALNRLPFIAPIRLLSSSVVQLAVTPQFPDELASLLRGLKFLHQTDPQVELAILPSGDHVIRCAGEVHAERCIEDLRTTFARVNLCVTDPIVGLRETIQNVNKIVMPNSNNNNNNSNVNNSKSNNNNNNYVGSNVITINFGGNNLFIQMAAISLPADILAFLMSNASEDHGSAPETAKKVVRMFKSTKLMDHRKSNWKRLFRVQKAKIIAWGPQKMNFCGNMLIDTTGSFPAGADIEDFASGRHVLNVVQEAIISGFELGTSRGPMADEPMFGLAFVIVGVSEALSGLLGDSNNNKSNDDSVDENESTPNKTATTTTNLPEGVFTGHIVSAMAQGCRQCFTANTSQQRIVEPVFECLVYSAGPTRGKIYSLLHRRRAQIGDEILQEGTDMFYIKSYLPATESFGLQDELRTLTSGAATAQLRVDHWETLEIDPYYKPTTKDEMEEQGSNIDKPNLAMTIIDQVRKRKGLYREQVVKHAEKQKFSIRGA